MSCDTGHRHLALGSLGTSRSGSNDILPSVGHPRARHGGLEVRNHVDPSQRRDVGVAAAERIFGAATATGGAVRQTGDKSMALDDTAAAPAGRDPDYRHPFKDTSTGKSSARTQL